MTSLLRNPARLVPLAFAAMILVGTALLSLPAARVAGEGAPLVTAFFTATSAVAVTGLAVVDTATYWSFFGQAVIYALFQIGGIGIMTSATLLVLLVARHLSLSRQLIVTAESRGIALGDVRSVLGFTLWVMAVVEGVVALVLFFHFQRIGLPGRLAAWHAIFQSGAAFTNAGFSTYAGGAAIFRKDPFFLAAIMSAVLVGGLGLPVLSDLKNRALRGRRLSLHSKLTLATTLPLFLFSGLVFAYLEWANPATFGGLSVADKLVNGLYQAFMARSCGMNAIDQTSLTEESYLATLVLMMVGGGSASTAGGLKVSTVAILFLAVWAEMRGNPDAQAFGRRMSAQVQREALTVLVLGLSVVTLGTATLCVMTDLPLGALLFEVVSAFANVGLSMNLTAELPPAGQAVVAGLMFVGRIGTITVAAALALRRRRSAYRYPEERPIVG